MPLISKNQQHSSPLPDPTLVPAPVPAPVNSKPPTALPLHKPILTFLTLTLQVKKVTMVTVSFGPDVREELLYEIAGPKMCLSSSFQAMVAKLERVASIICDI